MYFGLTSSRPRLPFWYLVHGRESFSRKAEMSVTDLPYQHTYRDTAHMVVSSLGHLYLYIFLSSWNFLIFWSRHIFFSKIRK